MVDLHLLRAALSMVDLEEWFASELIDEEFVTVGNFPIETSGHDHVESTIMMVNHGNYDAVGVANYLTTFHPIAMREILNELHDLRNEVAALKISGAIKDYVTRQDVEHLRDTLNKILGDW